MFYRLVEIKFFYKVYIQKLKILEKATIHDLFSQNFENIGIVFIMMRKFNIQVWLKWLKKKNCKWYKTTLVSKNIFWNLCPVLVTNEIIHKI